MELPELPVDLFYSDDFPEIIRRLEDMLISGVEESDLVLDLVADGHTQDQAFLWVSAAITNLKFKCLADTDRPPASDIPTSPGILPEDGQKFGDE